MIREAIISDAEPIAKELWNTWHHLKTQQVASPLHAYASRDVLCDEIRSNLRSWLVCEAGLQHAGFFAVSPLGSEKTFRKWRFPERLVQIEHFPSLFSGEVLVRHFQLLASHLPEASILLCVASTLREAYWAALKAGFRLLGESQLLVGTFAWLYLDRESRFYEIQSKLRRALFENNEPDLCIHGQT